MVWEVMILSLRSKKLSFMWLLLQWAHWLTACCLDLWAAGKKATGRLGDKSKTDWGRTDDLPRTMLEGHMFIASTTSLNCGLNGCAWYIRFSLLRREHEIWIKSLDQNKHSKYQIHMKLWTGMVLLILDAMFSTGNKTLYLLYLMQLITVSKAYWYLVTK